MLDPRHVPVPGGHLDLHAAVAWIDDRTVRLSPVEAAALSVLAEHANEAVSEEELLTRAWGYRTTNTRTVSVAMSRLRKKIEADPKSPQVLLTVRGVGYRLVPDVGAERPVLAVEAHLIGRDEELARLRASLERNPVVELVGVGGIGKSTLARAVWPDAVFVDLGGVATAGGLLRRLAEALRAPGPDGEAVVRAALGSRPRLLVDSAEGLDESACSLFGSLLEGARALVTTREPLGLGATMVVEGLGAEGALAVVNDARDAAGLPPVGADQVTPLCEAVGGHAMSLALAAPLVELGMTPEQVLQVPGASGQTPLARIQQTIAGLPGELRALLDALAAFVAAPIAAVAEVTGQGLPAVLHGVHELRVRGLVSVHDGAVALHAFVRLPGASAAARDRHAAWVAGHPLDPPRLRAIRREIEQALQHARGDALAAVLLRHLFVILTYGPGDALRAEVSPLVPRLPADGRRDVLWGMTLFHAQEIDAAQQALLAGCEALEGSDMPHRHDWLAIAWTHVSSCTAYTREMELSHRADAQLERLSDLAKDRTVATLCRMTWATNISGVDALAAARTFRAIEERDGTLPEWQLMASLSRLRLEPPTRAELLRVEALLDELGPTRLGQEAVAQRWLHIAQFWLAANGPERAWQLFEQWLPVYEPLHPRGALREVVHTALYALDTPDLARRLLAKAPQAPMADLVRWLLDPEGPPPADDEGLASVASAFAEGRPVPKSERFLRVTQALRDVQRRAATPPSR